MAGDGVSCLSLDPAKTVTCLAGTVSKAAAVDVFGSIAHDFATAADSTINWLWAQMSDATAIRLGGTAFNQLLAVAGLVAIVIAVGIFAIQMAISAVRRDPSGIGRAAGGLVVMGLGGGAAIAVTELLLQAVDAMSAGVLQVTTGDSMQQMGNSILAAGSISASTSNPAALILISLLALAAVVMVWLALTVRKLLVIVAAVFSPFAFAGGLADFSRSWVRRWVELIVALVFSKLILMFVFVTGLFVLLKGLGSTGSGGTQQITQTVSGVLILALAGFAPWVAIKMAHFAGVHLEGMHMTAGHATAGASAVQSMARPVGAAMMPSGMAGAAAAVASSSTKPWSPQTVANTSSGTESLSAVGKAAQSNLGSEEASSGSTPSANGSGPSSNGSPHTPDTTAASTNARHVDCRRRTRPAPRPRSQPREFFWQRNQAAAETPRPAGKPPRGRQHPRADPTAHYANKPPERKPRAMNPSAAFPAVSISPNTSGLPGLNELSNIVGAMLTVGAILCVLGVILSSAVWAVASTSGNVQLVSWAKTGTVVCGIAALLIGGASILITFFVNAGSAL